jgi:hypothetical protein
MLVAALSGAFSLVSACCCALARCLKEETIALA